MKKTLLLTLAASALCASQALALDLYITGATAFRANVHDAVKNLYDVTPLPASTLRYDLTSTNTAYNNGASQWVMTGTVSNTIPAFSNTVLTVHATFNGSVQGIAAVINKTKLQFLGFSNTTPILITNTATIAYSDCASASTPFVASGNWSESAVAVQPFVLCISRSANTNMNYLTNGITAEQLKYAIGAGQIPLSAWSFNTNDRSTLITLLQRTKDSGTRRTQLAQAGLGYNAPLTPFLWDATNNAFYDASGYTTAALTGNDAAGVGIVGAASAIADSANLSWGQGYVGGGDLRTILNLTHTNNLSFGYLSFADAKSAGNGNWGAVVPFNGVWPTSAGAGLRGITQVGTNVLNDFSPITKGTYPCWGQEICVYPTVNPSTLSSDQNLTAALLGNQSTTNTVLGVLNAVRTGTPILGSIDREIELSKTNLATAIRIKDMVSARTSVGGTITP
jgi:hypothetical protein